MPATWTHISRSLPPDFEPEMTHTEHTFIGTDNVCLYTQSWQPQLPARAAIIIVHGYAEYSSRYEHVAKHFVKQGISVHTYDQRGYGRSGGRRAFIRSFDEYVNDLAIFVARTKEQTAELPLLLFGHSMGGLISAHYCLRQDQAVDGLILSSPAIDVGQDVPTLVRKLARSVSLLTPTLPTVALDFDYISQDPDVVLNVRQDPLQYQGRMPARLGSEIMRAAAFVREHGARLRLPLLIIHGTADRIANPSGSWEIYGKAESMDKSLHLYEGLYHETFNEPQKQSVLNDISRWILQRL